MRGLAKAAGSRSWKDKRCSCLGATRASRVSRNGELWPSRYTAATSSTRMSPRSVPKDIDNLAAILVLSAQSAGVTERACDKIDHRPSK